MNVDDLVIDYHVPLITYTHTFLIPHWWKDAAGFISAHKELIHVIGSIIQIALTIILHVVCTY